MSETVILIALGSSVGINIVLLGAYRIQRNVSAMYQQHAAEYGAALLRIRCSQTRDPWQAIMEAEYEAERALEAANS